MPLACEVCLAGSAYCVTLATFATPADADLPAAYLDRYRRRPDLSYDQTAAMGALLHLDAELRSDRAARFPAPDGPWRQWIGGPPEGAPRHAGRLPRERQPALRLRGRERRARRAPP
ncbi:DUF6000 family protein [Actinacidiphila glaucinigra]|uniref:DUF6000 family protein n=1 Tax=Actinacidiphila glaucinigra TaxID=235986 RepID=UPI0037BD067D